MKTSFSFIDLCAGPGGCALGFLRAGFKCIGLFERCKKTAVLLRENFPPEIAPLLGFGEKANEAFFAISQRESASKPDVVLAAPTISQNPTNPAGPIISTPHFHPSVIIAVIPGKESFLDVAMASISVFKNSGYDTYPSYINSLWYGLPKEKEFFFVLGIKNASQKILRECWPPPRLFQGKEKQLEKKYDKYKSYGILIPKKEKILLSPPSPSIALECVYDQESSPKNWYGKLMKYWIPQAGLITKEKSEEKALLRKEARLFSLPDGYRLIGSIQFRLNTLERVIPPILSLVVARAVKAILKGEKPKDGFLPEATSTGKVIHYSIFA